MTHDVLAKLGLVGKDLDAYSLETVEMFHRDANAAGFAIAGPVASRAAAEYALHPPLMSGCEWKMS